MDLLVGGVTRVLSSQWGAFVEIVRLFKLVCVNKVHVMSHVVHVGVQYITIIIYYITISCKTNVERPLIARLYNYYTGRAGNFRRCKFRYLAPEPSAEICVGLIFGFNARKPHPPLALHVKYQCMGVSHFNFPVSCSALKLFTFPTIRYYSNC